MIIELYRFAISQIDLYAKKYFP
uniref:Uncharacterized protein n=1 Tax=Anguilla anguilla TaxID=7936 RepID=A0A0E9RVW8_ANGAN